MAHQPAFKQKIATLGTPDRNLFAGAFSLIEVVLAVGVVAFALLAITALLPNGIMTVRRAENLQATSNIANQLRGQLPLLSFGTSPGATNTLANLSSTTNYYTIDGLPTNSSGYYQASYVTTNFESGTTITNVAGTTFSTNNVVNVLVTLTYPPGLLNKTNTFSLLVSRQTDD